MRIFLNNGVYKEFQQQRHYTLKDVSDYRKKGEMREVFDDFIVRYQSKFKYYQVNGRNLFCPTDDLKKVKQYLLTLIIEYDIKTIHGNGHERLLTKHKKFLWSLL